MGDTEDGSDIAEKLLG